MTSRFAIACGLALCLAACAPQRSVDTGPDIADTSDAGSADGGPMDGGTTDAGPADAGCANPCGDLCCGPTQTCNSVPAHCMGACTSQCAGRVCGTDMCGGSCGTCPDGDVCSGSGQCESACTPDCTGRVCGSDGCTGTCFPGCSDGLSCLANGQCSCLMGGMTCTTFTDCCSMSCNMGTCGACQSAGGGCAQDSDCCSSMSCYHGTCQTCHEDNDFCSTFSDCCSGNCTAGSCVAACPWVGSNCSGADGGTCCAGLACNTAETTCCLPNGGLCASTDDCCSGSCVAGVCTCIAAGTEPPDYWFSDFACPYCCGTGTCVSDTDMDYYCGCLGSGASCAHASDCCTGTCTGGKCP